MRPVVALLAVLLAGCGSNEKPAATTAPKPKLPAPKILMFYPSHNVVGKGEKILVCYGVEDAAFVSIEPPVEQLKPSFNHCFETVPQKSGTYTLKAEARDGRTVEQSFEVKVEAGARTPAQKSAGHLIQFFAGNRKEIKRGEQVMLCYEVSNVAELQLTPDPHMPLGRPKGCVQVTPQADTTYKLTVKGTTGDTEADEVRVRVLP